jgi:hypothetical protein
MKTIVCAVALAVAAVWAFSASDDAAAAPRCGKGKNPRACAVAKTRSAPTPARRPAAAFDQPAPLNRPYGASPTQCYFDDGYGRFRPCDAGGSIN